MSTIGSLVVALNADVGGFTGTMASATRSINQFKKMGQTVFQETRTPLEQYQAGLRRLGALYHGGQVDAETFGRAVRKLNDDLRASQAAKGPSAGGQLAGGLLGFSTGVGATIVAANMAINAVKSVGNAMIDTGATAIKLAADFERAEISFTTLFKSATVAKQVMADVKQFAAATPFEFPELKDAAVKLAGFGISAKELVPTLKVLGDISAGTGANINELAETYGKARIQGRAYTRDVNEFANRGVPIWEALNKVMGTNSAETHKLVEDGKVGFRELQQAVISLTEAGGLFAGGLEAQSKSLYGLYSTIHDNLNLALAELGEKAASELGLKQLAQDAIELTSVLRNDAIPVIVELGHGLQLLSPSAGPMARALLGFDTMRESAIAAHEAILRLRLATLSIAGGGGPEALGEILKLSNELADLERRKQGISSGHKSPGAPTLEPGGNKTGIEEELAALERQAEMIGKTTAEKKLAELVTKGLLEADMEHAAALLNYIDAESALQSAEEQTRKTMESHIAALKQQADMFGMSAKEADLYKQSLAGANAEELEAIEAQHKRLEAQKESMESLKQISEENRAATSEIASIIEHNMTPLEKFNRDMERLNELKGQGLGEEQFGREAARLKQELDDATKPQGAGRRDVSNPALVAGTSQFYSAISRSTGGTISPEARDRKESLKIQRRQEIIERNMEKKLARQKVANF